MYRRAPPKSNALADNPRVRTGWLAAVGSVLLAAAVRLPALGSPSLASAEQTAFVESRGFAAEAAIPEGRPLDARELPRRPGPQPLDAAWLALWTSVAGTSEAALRFPSAVAGILTAGLVALVAARLAGPRAAAWGGTLVALSPIHALASREAGADAATLLLVATVLLLLLRVDESGGGSEAIALGLALGTLALCGAAGGGLALLAIAWLSSRVEGRPAATLATVAGLATLAAGALAGRARPPLDFGAIPSWVPATGPSGLVRCAGASFTRVAGLEYHLVVPRALEVLPLTAALVGLMAWGAWRLPRRARALLVAGAALPFVLGAALALIVGRVTPLQAHRMLPALPFVVTLAAAGLAASRGFRARAVGVAVGATVATFLALALRQPVREPSPTRATARAVAGCRPGIVVVDRPLDLLALAAWDVSGPFLLRTGATPAPASPAVVVGPESACAARGAACGPLPACPTG